MSCITEETCVMSKDSKKGNKQETQPVATVTALPSPTPVTPAPEPRVDFGSMTDAQLKDLYAAVSEERKRRRQARRVAFDKGAKVRVVNPKHKDDGKVGTVVFCNGRLCVIDVEGREFQVNVRNLVRAEGAGA